MTTGFERYSKKTRRAQFLEEMEQVVPWRELRALIEPHYPKAGNGRPPVGVERMLRIYFLQQWFNLSDPAVEEALYDSPVMRQFAGIDLGNEPVPDETTVCKFRHLLEEHRLGGEILETVNLYLQQRGVRISTGTIVDATIIHAPSSTKNQQQERDPEMHQTSKGRQWYFGMKAHVGVDSKSKLVHTVVARRPTWPTRQFCRSCCMVRRRTSGAIRPIAGRAMSFMNVRRVLKTAPTSAIATRTGLMRWNGQRTGRSRGCARKSSMCSPC